GFAQECLHEFVLSLIPKRRTDAPLPNVCVSRATGSTHCAKRESGSGAALRHSSPGRESPCARAARCATTQEFSRAPARRWYAGGCAEVPPRRMAWRGVRRAGPTESRRGEGFLDAVGARARQAADPLAVGLAGGTSVRTRDRAS